MPEHAVTIPYLRELVLFLAVTGLVVPLLKRFRVNPILGFLLAGIAIGPYGFALLVPHGHALDALLIRDKEGIHALAELGVIFLLFMIGLELSVDRVLQMRRLVFGLGGAQVIVTALLLTLIALMLGATPAASAVIGACLALSSTAIVLGLLGERGALGTQLGRTSFGILLFQDIAVVPILALIGVLAAGEVASMPAALGLALLKAIGAMAAILILGRMILRPVFHFVGRAKSAELFTAVTLLTIIGTSALTGLAGLSMPLGAFLAGLVLSETEFRHQVEVDIGPVKGLLLGLFFVSVGMGTDLRLLASEAGPIIGAVAGLFLLKALVIIALVRLFGFARAIAIECGLLLGGAGEFVFVVAALATSLNVLDEYAGQFLTLVTGLSMIATPIVAIAAERLAARFKAPDGSGLGEIGEVPADHIIIAGFGRAGRLLAGTLRTENIPTLGLDLNSAVVSAARAAGEKVYFGDAGRGEILKSAGAAHAQALVVTMDDPEAAEAVVRHARAEWPNLPIFARARDLAHANALVTLGATRAVPENLEASLQLAEHVFEGLGYPAEAAERLIDERRKIEFDMSLSKG